MRANGVEMTKYMSQDFESKDGIKKWTAKNGSKNGKPRKDILDLGLIEKSYAV